MVHSLLSIMITSKQLQVLLHRLWLTTVLPFTVLPTGTGTVTDKSREFDSIPVGQQKDSFPAAGASSLSFIMEVTF